MPFDEGGKERSIIEDAGLQGIDITGGVMRLSEPSAERMRDTMIESWGGFEVSTILHCQHCVPGFGSWQGPDPGSTKPVALLRILATLLAVLRPFV